MISSRSFLIADLLMVAVVSALPHLASMPMLIYPPVVLTMLWAYLRWRGATFADLGFRWQDCSWKAFGWGCLIGIVWALVLFFWLGPLILQLTGLPPADLSDFEAIRNSWSRFVTLLLVAWLLVIPYEELVFRGFVLTVLRRMVDDTSPPPSFGARSVNNRKSEKAPTAFRFWIAAVLHAIIFAGYHWQEGGSALISIFLGSLLTAWLYRLFKGNLWYLIFFHAAYDTVMLSLFRYGHL